MTNAEIKSRRELGLADYEVVKSKYDASRPYAVVTQIRSYNKIMGRYATEQQAKRRARVLNKTA